MSLRILAVVTTVLAAASPAFAAGRPIAELPPGLHHVPMAGAAFPGAPPPFVIPPGGTASTEQAADGTATFTLRRADGSRFAFAHSQMNGDVDHAVFFGVTGDAAVETTADYLSDPSALNRTTASAARPHRRSVNCTATNWYRESGQMDPSLYWTWYYVSGSTPSNVSVNIAEDAMRSGHSQWAFNYNPCGVPDNANELIAYGGRIGSAFGYNGYSTVGFGDMYAIGCGGAYACTANYFGPYNTLYYAESDQRFSNTVTWNPECCGSTSGPHIQAVATHETGHSLGFAHDPCNCGNIMDTYMNPNNSANNQLGIGDATGNNSVY